jgi:glycine/D-amino acid oxidase-like deaminating enzyme
MYQRCPTSIIGAGIAGAWQALLLAQAGHCVTLHERSGAAMKQSTSHWAGGMLAPYCEAETTEPVTVRRKSRTNVGCGPSRAESRPGSKPTVA